MDFCLRLLRNLLRIKRSSDLIGSVVVLVIFYIILNALFLVFGFVNKNLTLLA